MKIKKYNKFILSLLMIVLTISCDDFFDLNKEPLDLISSSKVYDDPDLADAYLAGIYQNTWNYGPGVWNTYHWNGAYDNPQSFGVEVAMGGLWRGLSGWQATYQLPRSVIDGNGAQQLDYWPYKNIREANTLIQGLENSASLDQTFIDQKVSEARFIRAQMYFDMVKRFGGVPIIKEPQSPDAPAEELNLPRNSEKEVFDFIASEMDAIAPMLNDNSSGRATKWAAYALKSRAMLYAASVAQFGTQQLDGLLGFPAGEAQSYWQKAYDASMKIISDGGFSLYNRVPGDPVENFTRLFVDENANPEKIMVLNFDFDLKKGQRWGEMTNPDFGKGGFTANFPCFLEGIEEFEYKDGSDGAIDRSTLTFANVHNIDSLFRNRDPRCVASYHFAGDEYGGDKVWFHNFTVNNFDWQNPIQSGEVAPGIPAKGTGGRNNGLTTAILCRKVKNPDETPQGGEPSVDYTIYRFAEVLLNAAEAAFYLGDPDGNMKTHIDMIRNRAQMPLYADITEDIIRTERKRELQFEYHRFWDLRRWRVAVEKLNDKQFTGLQYILQYPSMLYTITTIPGEAGKRVFQERNYYLPLGIQRVADNTKFVENPDY